MNQSVDIEQHFEQEILRSERVRTLALSVFLILSSLYFIALGRIRPDAFISVFGSASAADSLAIIFAIIGFLELVLAWRLTQLIRSGNTISRIALYLVAFLEISFPTMTIIHAASYFPAPYAISCPSVLIYFIFILLSALRLDIRLCLFTGAVASLQYFAVVFYYLVGSTWPEMPPQVIHPLNHAARIIIIFSSGVAMGLVAWEARRRLVAGFQAVMERDQVIDLFGQHVSSSVVESLLASGTRPETDIRHVCVMFLDVRNFTSFTENRSPTEVVSYLNNLYELIAETVDRHKGIVNKFLGDGCLAIFGAPLSDGHDSQNAVAAAQELVRTVEEECTAGRLFPTKIGIGLHAGPVVTGSVGSQRRKEYTIIGDVVNVAARIEQMTKNLNAEILTSEEVWNKVSDDVDGKMIGEVPVRGRSSSIKVYEVSSM